MGLGLGMTKSPEKSSPLSESRPPVRPPDELTQREFMLPDDLR
jgi:hypothetical protein